MDDMFKKKPKKIRGFEKGELAIVLDYPEGEQLRIYDGNELLLYKDTLSEISRLRKGIEFAIDNTHDDETWDYLNHLLKGTESKSMYHRFDKE